MNEKIQKYWQDIHHMVWELDERRFPLYKRFPVRAIRIAYAVIRDLRDGQLNLRAMSLVYTTLLSLVPLLAISFSVLKGFGVHNQIEPMLLNLLAPLGDQSVEITEKIIGFVDNIKIGVLGALGVGLLLYSVISLMQKIERSFNYTWHVTQERTFAERFSDYLSVLLVGPLLIFLSMGITTSFRNAPLLEKMLGIDFLGGAVQTIGLTIPYLIIIAAFSFIYSFMPNTKVKMSAAIVGAIVTGVVWKTLGWGFSTFVAGSTNYTAVYSTFATIIVFMIWIYLGWMVLLVGASIAYYTQNPRNVMLSRDQLRLSNRVKMKLGLMIMILIGKGYAAKKQVTVETLCQDTHMPMYAVDNLIDALISAGLVVKTGGENAGGFVPAEPLDQMLVDDVIHSIRASHEQKSLSIKSMKGMKSLDTLIAGLDDAQVKHLKKTTIRDLV